MLLACWVLATSGNADRPLVAAACGVAASLSLVAARRLPFLPLAATFAGMLGAIHFAGYPGPDDPYIATLVCASFMAGLHARLRTQPWAAAAVLLMLALNVGNPELTAGDVVFPTLFTGAPWLLGLLLQLARHRETEALIFAGAVEAGSAERERHAAAEARMEIARELHDVVTHNISALSLQAQVCRRQTAAGHPVAVEDLRLIEETAQAAMTDLRRIVGVLRPDDGVADLDGPESDEEIGSVDELVELSTRAGHRVELVVQGTPRDLPPALSLAAYRIVQEALTNARRHGSTGRIQLTLDWREHSLGVHVSNSVSRASANTSNPGHGLDGMAERVRMFGGTLNAGPAPDGSWIVEADLPTPLVRVETR
jgi:signal transduction histidine kinase